MKNNDVVHISDGDNWELLYINGKKRIEGHQIYTNDLLREISELEGKLTCHCYVLANPEEEGDAWKEVFVNAPSDLIHILHWLTTDQFEER